MATPKNTDPPPEPAPKPRRNGPHSIVATTAVWRKLATNVRSKLEEMPHLAEQLAEFEAIVTRLEAAIAEQDLMSAKSRGQITARDEVVLQGKELRNRLTAQLQGRFGLASDELRGFGLKPRKRKLRPKPAGENPPPAPEEPPASS